MKDFTSRYFTLQELTRSQIARQRGLDTAYSIAFPKSTPINVSKKAPEPPKGERRGVKS